MWGEKFSKPQVDLHKLTKSKNVKLCFQLGYHHYKVQPCKVQFKIFKVLRNKEYTLSVSAKWIN